MKAYIKIQKTIEFDEIEIKKPKIHQHKEPFSIKEIQWYRKIVKYSKIVILISNKVSFGKKIWIFPKMIAYRKDFDETNFMYFLVKDDEYLENYKWHLGKS